MSPSDRWLEKKYEMIFDGFKESRKTTFFFTYWIAAFNIAYILLIFSLQMVPILQCSAIIVLTIIFTIFSAIVRPMKTKTGEFIYFFNFG
mgnify:FL=1